MKTCKIDECENRISARGMCSTHYWRERRGGDLYAPVVTPRQGGSAYTRVIEWTKESPTGCLLFTGCISTQGYGVVRVNGKAQYAHRIVLEHSTGPSDLFALHSCDTPACVRLEHLRWGTRSENSLDMYDRGRFPLPSISRLSDEEIQEIRASQMTQAAIAERYGIVQSHVSNIKSGRRRRRVPQTDNTIGRNNQMRKVTVVGICDRCGEEVLAEDAGYGILVALGSKTTVRADLCNTCLELAHDALDKSIANGVRADSNGHNGNGNGNGRSRGNWGKREQVACPLCEKLISVGAGQVLHARKIHGQEKEDVWGLQTQAPA